MHDEKQRQIRQREIQEAKRVHLQKYVDLHAQAGENGVKAAKQRKSKMKKLDKLGVAAQGTGKRWKASYDGEAEEVEEFVEEEDVVLRFPDPGSFQGDIVKMDQVTFGYDVSEKPLLNKVDLGVNMQSRVALLGRNGCGKVTFYLLQNLFFHILVIAFDIFCILALTYWSRYCNPPSPDILVDTYKTCLRIP